MTKYKIGELTKTMGVSSHTLKHYEKFDIVSPVKDDNTNYRYYDLSQYNRIIQCKKYRNIGIPIKDTASIMNTYSNEQIKTSLKNHIANLDESITQLMHQKKLTENLLSEYNSIDKYLNDWFIYVEEPIYLLKQSNNNSIIPGTSCQNSKTNLINYAPETKSILYIDKNSLSGEKFNYSWSVGITETAKNAYNLELNEQYIKISPGKCFVTYLKTDTPFIKNNVLLNMIHSSFDKYSFIPSGDILAVLCKITHTGETKNEEFYFKIIIPI